MRVTGIHAVGKCPDAPSFDAGLERLYVASESGAVAAFERKGESAVKLGESYVARQAHWVALDAQHRGYFPLQNVYGHPVVRITAPTAE